MRHRFLENLDMRFPVLFQYDKDEDRITRFLR